jgi:hypothetical protein
LRLTGIPNKIRAFNSSNLVGSNTLLHGEHKPMTLRIKSFALRHDHVGWMSAESRNYFSKSDIY